MNESDVKRAIERANSYRQMAEQWAWKDFSLIMDDTRRLALEKAIVCSTLEDVQIQRGIVKCIDSLRSELGSILEAV